MSRFRRCLRGGAGERTGRGERADHGAAQPGRRARAPPDDAPGYDNGDESGYGSESSYGPYRPSGFGIQVYGGGSANEYGPYGYPDRGYGVYAEWGYRNGRSSVRGAFDYGRRDGYDAGIDAARYGRYEPFRHHYYQSTRGWAPRFGGRDAYDVNYRNGFR